MGKTKTTITVIAIAGAAVTAGVGLILFPTWQTARRQVRLLSKTDHQALLAACRELSRKTLSRERKVPGGSVCFGPGSSSPDIPQPIRDLRPRQIIIDDDGEVTLSMDNKWWPFGVRAYPEGFEDRYADFKYGDRKLIEGLWYYDHGYDGHPEYDKQIDTLLRRNKTYQAYLSETTKRL
jgi:hypothetical protein